MLLPTIGKKTGENQRNTSSEKLLVFIIKRSIIALREEINPLDDNKKIDNILMKSRMYVMYVSKKNKKERLKYIPQLLKSWAVLAIHVFLLV